MRAVITITDESGARKLYERRTPNGRIADLPRTLEELADEIRRTLVAKLVEEEMRGE